MADKLKKLLAKLKENRGLTVLIAIVLMAVLMVVYFLVKENEKTSLAKDNVTQEISLTEEMEKKLTQILSEIDGVGQVNVMITYDSSTEVVYESVENESVFNASQELVVVKEKMPKVIGVVVVAEGADKLKTKINLVNAVVTALNIDSSKVQVFNKYN